MQPTYHTNPLDLANFLDGKIDNSSQYAILRVLMDCGHRNDWLVTLSINQIVKLSLTSRTTVIRTMRELQSSGLITDMTVEANTAKTYKVNVPCGGEAQR